MNLLALLPGLLLPAFGGWLGLRIIEGHHPVLLRLERWTLGCVLGLAYAMFLVFCAQIFFAMPLTRAGFLTIIGGSLVILLLLFRLRRLPWRTPHIALHASPPLSKRARILWGFLLGWIVLRAVIVGTVFLTLTPTYLDDALDNWNLRGKVFFFTQKITLVMPNEDPLISPLDVSSYPPAVPLMKTWLAVLAGDWSEPLVNSIHLLWYAAALVLVFSGLRRHVTLPWALLGAYLLGSLPLFLMHGTNTYADAFMAVHLFAALSFLFHALSAEHEHDRWTLLKIAALATAILPFAKNEGLLVYLPPLLLLFLWNIWRSRRRLPVSKTILWWGINLLMVIGPWLLFKWSRGLSFGNGKPFTSLGIGWQENVLTAIFINTFFEGNWLLLFPLFFGLFLWKWQRAFTTYGLLTAFVLIVYIGQACLYLFTGLATEALRQTGYARGLVHLVPIIVFLTTLLLRDHWHRSS